jgi:hypothetical protein
MKPEPDGESSSHSEHHLNDIKQDENPATKPSTVKTEHEVSCMSVFTLDNIKVPVAICLISVFIPSQMMNQCDRPSMLTLLPSEPKRSAQSLSTALLQ